MPDLRRLWLPALHFWFRLAWRQTALALAIGLVLLPVMGTAAIEDMLHPSLTVTALSVMIILAPFLLLAFVLGTAWIIQSSLWARPFRYQEQSWRFALYQGGREVAPDWGKAWLVYWALTWRGLLINIGMMAVAWVLPMAWLVTGFIAQYGAAFWFLSKSYGNLKLDLIELSTNNVFVSDQGA
ncbi:hypothetical protein [Thiomonas sp.]